MKNYLSKNVLIAAFVATNVVGSVYIADQKFGIINRFRRILAHEAVRVKADTAKHGELTPGFLIGGEDGLQGCYEAFLARQPGPDEGTVQVHMTIDPAGTVDQLKLVHSDLEEPEFQTCVLDKIKSSRVVATPERLGVIISHHFHFKRKQLDQVSFEN
jgi:hypothetical protein